MSQYTIFKATACAGMLLSESELIMHTELAEIIAQKIRTGGAISFRDFMEMCLYYPQLGYYTSDTDKLGKNGDYFTSSCIASLFGALIGRQIEQMWHITGRAEFTVIEYGAGTGLLCRDILGYLASNQKLYNLLHYCIIEKSASMREKEKQLLPPEKVTWLNSLHDIPPVTGCIISNELVDNFAVHQIVMEDELMEVFVDYETDRFIEVLQPAGEQLTDYLKGLNIALPKGFRTEINLEAIHWITEIAHCLKKGYVLTIDYGYSAAELYHERRKQGTLVCYNNHTVNTDPYQEIGRQDITTHVNFSALYYSGIKCGLNCCGFTDQAHFLLSLGFNEYLNKIPGDPHELYSYYKKRLFLLNTLLLDMGSKFKVLIQQKGITRQKLLGLKSKPQYLAGLESLSLP